MGKIVFVLGGARSGKSSYALNLAKGYGGKKPAFIATCEGRDKEMRQRIRLHRKTRPGHWRTFEETTYVATLLKKIGNEFDIILLDCVTLLLSNLLSENFSEKKIEKEIDAILSVLRKIKSRAILVANEVGLGIVPQNELGRKFRDIAGRTNQIIAEKSDEVFFIIAGIPRRIK